MAEVRLVLIDRRRCEEGGAYRPTFGKIIEWKAGEEKEK